MTETNSPDRLYRYLPFTDKAHQPDLLLDLLNSYRLAGEGLAEVGLQRPHADAPAPCDGDGAVVEGVLELR